MDERVERIIAGERFCTGDGHAHVTQRCQYDGHPENDYLLLDVLRVRGAAYKAWTTIPALMLNIETGTWLLPDGEHRLAA